MMKESGSSKTIKYQTSLKPRWITSWLATFETILNHDIDSLLEKPWPYVLRG